MRQISPACWNRYSAYSYEIVLDERFDMRTIGNPESLKEIDQLSSINENPILSTKVNDDYGTYLIPINVRFESQQPNANAFSRVLSCWFLFLRNPAFLEASCDNDIDRW